MSSVAYVQIQTMRGSAGVAEMLKEVKASVATFNSNNKGKEAHIVEHIPVLPNSTKGMQYQLALVATLARRAGANMVRLGVHGGQVAICGTRANVAATIKSVQAAHNAISTACANAYDAGKHGPRVSFTNAYLCGAPAGLQTAWKISATQAYGVGFLFTFPAPPNTTAYALGNAAGATLAKSIVVAAKAGKPAPTATTTNDAPTTDDGTLAKVA
jgi:hypothetical protein